MAGVGDGHQVSVDGARHIKVSKVHINHSTDTALPCPGSVGPPLNHPGKKGSRCWGHTDHFKGPLCHWTKRAFYGHTTTITCGCACFPNDLDHTWLF